MRCGKILDYCVQLLFIVVLSYGAVGINGAGEDSIEKKNMC